GARGGPTGPGGARGCSGRGKCRSASLILPPDLSRHSHMPAPERRRYAVPTCKPRLRGREPTARLVPSRGRIAFSWVRLGRRRFPVARCLCYAMHSMARFALGEQPRLRIERESVEHITVNE